MRIIPTKKQWFMFLFLLAADGEQCMFRCAVVVVTNVQNKFDCTFCILKLMNQNGKTITFWSSAVVVVANIAISVMIWKHNKLTVIRHLETHFNSINHLKQMLRIEKKQKIHKKKPKKNGKRRNTAHQRRIEKHSTIVWNLMSSDFSISYQWELKRWNRSKLEVKFKALGIYKMSWIFYLRFVISFYKYFTLWCCIFSIFNLVVLLFLIAVWLNKSLLRPLKETVDINSTILVGC